MNCHYFKRLALFGLTALLMPMASFAEDVEIDGISYTISSDLTAEVISGSYSGEIVIPSSVTYEEQTYSVESIAKSAFANSGLTSVFIPASVSVIGNGAFEGCKSLTSIQVEEGNPTYDSRDNCNAIVNTASNTLIYGCQTTVIPATVTTIGSGAFSGQTGLTAITIPESLTSVASDAFKGCTGLTSVTINSLDLIAAPRTPKTSFKSIFGDQVENYEISVEASVIGNYAFYGCTAMKSFSIPDIVTEIGTSAFSMCSGLTSITLPAGLTTVSSHAFYKCSGLTSISIPEGVTVIDDDAFSLCRGLQSVGLPGSLTRIGTAAFYGCSELPSIDIPEEVDSIGRDAFSYCLALTSIEIPSGVQYIGNFTFYSCQSLNTVKIGAGVAAIGSNAFSYCTQLGLIECYTEVMPEIEDDAFVNVSVAGISLLVPEDQQEEFRNHPVWGMFFDDSEGTTFYFDDPTGIRSAGIEAQAMEAYDLSGRKQSGLQRGLNVVRMTDGTTKKVIVK